VIKLSAGGNETAIFVCFEMVGKEKALPAASLFRLLALSVRFACSAADVRIRGLSGLVLRSAETGQGVEGCKFPFAMKDERSTSSPSTCAGSPRGLRRSVDRGAHRPALSREGVSFWVPTPCKGGRPRCRTRQRKCSDDRRGQRPWIATLLARDREVSRLTVRRRPPSASGRRGADSR